MCSSSSSTTLRRSCIVSFYRTLRLIFKFNINFFLLETWHQQRQELNELRNRLEAQSIVISEQATRLASADLLVKDLYVENSHLTATIQRMEQQITRQTLMHLAQHHQPKQMGSLGSITGMP